ncbi:MAG: alpha/beta fold hydrolase [Pyrinomonadaceae bacterium]
MPFIENNSVRIRFESNGNGTPLILVPGFASGAWLWFCQIEFLSKHFRVLTFDPRGVGESTIKDEFATASIEGISSDIKLLIDELELDKVNILGTSFGGFVAQKFALENASRVENLILACTSFGGPNHVAPDSEVLAAFAATDGLNTEERIRKYYSPTFSPEFLAEHPETVEQVINLRLGCRVPQSVYMQQLVSATTFNFEDSDKNIQTRTLVLSGTMDTIVPLKNSENLASVLPNAHLKLIEGGSHLFFIEKPKEFNLCVEEFINE